MLRIIVTILIYCFIGWLLCDIDPYRVYHWWSGIWHGIFFVCNLLRSWLGDALFKAEYHTIGYNLCFWIFSIGSVLGLIGSTDSDNR